MLAEPSLIAQCQFGVTVFEDGSMSELKVGHFTADQAEEIASRLVVLASAIRNAGRRAPIQHTDDILSVAQ